MLTGCSPVIYKALPKALALDRLNSCSYITHAMLDCVINQRTDNQEKIKLL